MRRMIAFPCGPDTLIGSLDEAAGTTGLLIVSGGNEPRAGAGRGLARLAARLAAAGVPVFRFDRRGVGDSGGDNRGYAGSSDDIAAAVACFRAEAPHVTRLVGFGNCDAATALALWGQACDSLVLANPWVVERAAGDLPPPAAVRARYRAQLFDPRAWWRLLTGGGWLKLLRGTIRATERSSDALIRQVAAALAGREASVVLATGDATAIAWEDAARRVGLTLPTVRLDTASHSFVGASEGLERALLDTIAQQPVPDGG